MLVGVGRGGWEGKGDDLLGHGMQASVAAACLPEEKVHQYERLRPIVNQFCALFDVCGFHIHRLLRAHRTLIGHG